MRTEEHEYWAGRAWHARDGHGVGWTSTGPVLPASTQTKAKTLGSVQGVGQFQSEQRQEPAVQPWGCSSLANCCSPWLLAPPTSGFKMPVLVPDLGHFPTPGPALSWEANVTDPNVTPHHLQRRGFSAWASLLGWWLEPPGRTETLKVTAHLLAPMPKVAKFRISCHPSLVPHGGTRRRHLANSGPQPASGPQLVAQPTNYAGWRP